MKTDLWCEQCKRPYRLSEFRPEETYYECDSCSSELTSYNLRGHQTTPVIKQAGTETLSVIVKSGSVITMTITAATTKPWAVGCLYSLIVGVAYVFLFAAFAGSISVSLGAPYDIYALAEIFGGASYYLTIPAFIWGYYRQAKKNGLAAPLASHRPAPRPPTPHRLPNEEGYPNTASCDSRQDLAYVATDGTRAVSMSGRHIFLSYSSQDRDLALEFKRALEGCGLNVWLDLDRINHGSLIVDRLERALDDAYAFVVLVTPASLSSDWVREECYRALHLSIQTAFRLPVIPVAVDATAVPGFLANRRILQLPARNQIPSIAALLANELSADTSALQLQPRRTRIRWHSRCEGFADGDVSALAIFETIAAVVAVVILSTYVGSLTYITGLALIAPFALLQTNQSRSMGVRLLQRLQWWNVLRSDAEGDSRVAKTLRFAAFVSALTVPTPVHSETFTLFLLRTVAANPPFVLVILAMTPPMLVRFIATVLTSIRHPLNTLQAVPANWKNLILCKDLLEEPEVIPGYLSSVSSGELSDDLRIPNFLRGITRRPTARVFCDNGLTLVVTSTLIALAFCTAIIFYVPYYAARWALKSTAVIWTPLLWLASAANGTTSALYLRLRVLAEDATSRTVYVFSWLALIFIAALRLELLPFSLSSVGGFSEVAFFVKQPLPWLCIASASLIAIALRLTASRVLLFYYHKPMPLAAIGKAMNIATFIQRLIVVILLVMLVAKLLS